MSKQQSLTDQPLRILHSEAAVSFGGQEHRILKEMLAMRERGHHIELACRPEAQLVERMRALGFTVHTVPMGGLGNFVRGVLKFRKILKQGRFDVLNTHSRKDTADSGLGCQAGWNTADCTHPASGCSHRFAVVIQLVATPYFHRQ